GGDSSGSQNPHGIVRIANCMITGNDLGMTTALSGQTLSRVSNNVNTNTIEGNGTNGGPSGSYTAKQAMLRMRAIVIVLSVTSSAMAARNRVAVRGSGVEVGTCPCTAPCSRSACAYGYVPARGEF